MNFIYIVIFVATCVVISAVPVRLAAEQPMGADFAGAASSAQVLDGGVGQMELSLGGGLRPFGAPALGARARLGVSGWAELRLEASALPTRWDREAASALVLGAKLSLLEGESLTISAQPQLVWSDPQTRAITAGVVAEQTLGSATLYTMWTPGLVLERRSPRRALDGVLGLGSPLSERHSVFVEGVLAHRVSATSLGANAGWVSQLSERALGVVTLGYVRAGAEHSWSWTLGWAWRPSRHAGM